MLLMLLQGLGDAIESKLNDPVLSGALVSAYVQTLDGEKLFEHNAATRVMPAHISGETV